MAYSFTYGNYTDTSGGSNFIRAYIYYEIITTQTTVSCHWWAGCDIKSNYSTNAKLTMTTVANGTTRSATVDNKGWGGGAHAMVKDITTSKARGTSGTSFTITAKLQAANVSKYSSVTLTVSVPVKNRYVITYDTKGSDSTIAPYTNYYGTTYTLPTPTKTGNAFQGWATSDGGAVVYQPGATYTIDGAKTLYAVWQVTYTAPSLIGEITMYRTDIGSLGSTYGPSNRPPTANLSGTTQRQNVYIEFVTDKGVNITNPNYIQGSTVPYAEWESQGSIVQYEFDSASWKCIAGENTNTYYGIIQKDSTDFDRDLAYDISVTPYCSTNTSPSTIINFTVNSFISAEIYEIDISADGKRVAFGQKATDNSSKFGVEIYGDLYIEGQKVERFIIETGTSNGWTYRLWNDNLIEATRVLSGSQANYTTIASAIGGYRFSNIVTPFTMSDTNYYISGDWSIGNGFGVHAGTLSKTTTTFNAYGWSNIYNGSTVSVSVTLYLRGYKATS